MNTDIFLSAFEWKEPPDIEPPQYPVSIIDVERCPPMKMDLPMQDPCPVCGAFRMRVGDWVCFGFCAICYDESEEEFYAP